MDDVITLTNYDHSDWLMEEESQQFNHKKQNKVLCFTDLGAAFSALMLCEILLKQNFRSPKFSTDTPIIFQVLLNLQVRSYF